MKLNKLIKFSIIFLLFFGVLSCRPQEDKPIEKSTADKLDEIINSEGGKMTPNGQVLVLTTRAFVTAEEKTLSTGMPVRFIVKYDKQKPDNISIVMSRFSFGKMPVEVDFSANATLNYEAAAPKNRRNWLHFYSNSCSTAALVKNPEESLLTDERIGNSVIDGYINPDTGEIEFLIVFNVMGVKSIVIPQKIDLTRVHRFEEELADYTRRHTQGG